MTKYRHLCIWILPGGALLLGLTLSACGSNGGSSNSSSGGWGGIYANRVINYSPFGHTQGDTSFYVPSNIIGPPEGTQQIVVSLGDNRTGTGGSITAGFGAAVGSTPTCIVDQPGDDFIVVENVFTFSDALGIQNYTEAAYVDVYGASLSDGPYRFPSTFPNPGDSLAALRTEVGKPTNYSGLAGITVGGDQFDLNTIIVANHLPSTFQACYVRIQDAGVTIPDYDSNGLLMNPDGSGADIDAVQALNSAPAPGQTP